MSKYMEFKWFREIKSKWISRKCSQIPEKGHSGIILFVYEGKEEMHEYVQYEVSMPVCMGRTTNQGKISKWLPFKNYYSDSLNI